ncbi:MAG: hypothetical protein ABJH93_19200, partial [Roseibium sp.]|uniref:hypothetical protein n=1 Tax=Roseibium sp. TaxID=1936156 RepID=UPI0032973454
VNLGSFTFSFLHHFPEKLRRAADKREPGQGFDPCDHPQVISWINVAQSECRQIDQREIEIVHPVHAGGFVETPQTPFGAQPEAYCKQDSDEQVRKQHQEGYGELCQEILTLARKRMTDTQDRKVRVNGDQKQHDTKE